MALRQRGKQGFWHAYFRRVTALPDGRLKYTTTTVNLGTSDLREARALEAELMRKNRETRLHQRYLAHLARLDRDATATPGAPEPDLRPVREHKRKRLKLTEWREAALKYRELSQHSMMLFQHFVDHVQGVKYFDEVTPEHPTGSVIVPKEEEKPVGDEEAEAPSDGAGETEIPAP